MNQKRSNLKKKKLVKIQYFSHMSIKRELFKRQEKHRKMTSVQNRSNLGKNVSKRQDKQENVGI